MLKNKNQCCRLRSMSALWGLETLWDSISTAGVLPGSLSGTDSPQSDGLTPGNFDSDSASEFSSSSSRPPAGSLRRDADRPSSRSRQPDASPLCHEAHRGRCSEVHHSWAGHVDGIKQAMLRFSYDEHQGGRSKKGARAQESETLKINFVQDFNALTSDKAKLKTLEGDRQQRCKDLMLECHKLQFYSTAQVSGKVVTTTTKSNASGLKEVKTIFPFVPCQHHHIAECRCAVCMGRVLESTQHAFRRTCVRNDSEDTLGEIRRLQALISPAEDKDSPHWQALREAVRRHKNLNQAHDIQLPEAVGVYSFGPDRKDSSSLHRRAAAAK